MDRQPTRIHPSTSDGEAKIVMFADGARLVPEYLARFVAADSYPQYAYQEWVEKVANKEMEARFVRQAIGLVRAAHFG